MISPKSEASEHLFERNLQRLCQRVESVNSRRYGSVFNLRQVRPPYLSQIRKLNLRQAATLAQLADSAAKPDWERDCHFPIVAAIVGLIVRFTEHRNER